MTRVLAQLLTALLAASALLLPSAGALAQQAMQASARVVTTASWVEEWDPATQSWVRVNENAAEVAAANFEAHTTTTNVSGGVTITETVLAEPVRFIARPMQTAGQSAGLAQFGPFRVLDGTRAALIASTDAASPQAFAAMLAAYPGLEVIEFVDAPGTNNDLANLRLGRAIRAAGLATHVPDGGSARSGAVELFLAGTHRTIAPGALFAVHSWRDELGREPADFAPDAPENRLYLDYYAEMGMAADEARAFYAMTNSVPHAGALWLEGADMARWIVPSLRDRYEFADLLAAPVSFALLQSGQAVTQIASGKLAARLAIPPQLAYADMGAVSLALLDSGKAFP